METLARTGAPVTLVVFSNSVFGWIKAGQNSGFGQRYFSVDFSQTNHARVAEPFGLKAWRVEDPSQLRGALAAAIENGGPKLGDVVTQPLQAAAAPVTGGLVDQEGVGSGKYMSVREDLGYRRT